MAISRSRPLAADRRPPCASYLRSFVIVSYFVAEGEAHGTSEANQSISYVAGTFSPLPTASRWLAGS